MAVISGKIFWTSTSFNYLSDYRICLVFLVAGVVRAAAGSHLSGKFLAKGFDLHLAL
jgi:hypothetical protein